MPRTTRYAQNPDFCSSSFYLPKKVNRAFNRAMLDLQDDDYDIDRSRVISFLMEQWAANPQLPESFKSHS